MVVCLCVALFVWLLILFVVECLFRCLFFRFVFFFLFFFFACLFVAVARQSCSMQAVEVAYEDFCTQNHYEAISIQQNFSVFAQFGVYREVNRNEKKIQNNKKKLKKKNKQIRTNTAF